jgi:hypothetical protein
MHHTPELRRSALALARQPDYIQEVFDSKTSACSFEKNWKVKIMTEICLNCFFTVATRCHRFSCRFCLKMPPSRLFPPKDLRASYGTGGTALPFDNGLLHCISGARNPCSTYFLTFEPDICVNLKPILSLCSPSFFSS